MKIDGQKVGSLEQSVRKRKTKVGSKRPRRDSDACSCCTGGMRRASGVHDREVT